MKYHVDVISGQGMTMPDMKLRKTCRFVVRHTDSDMIAWRGTNLFASVLESRSGNGYRLQANKAAKNLQAHLERTGKRWELEQMEQRAVTEREQIDKQAFSQARTNLRGKAWAIIELLESNGWENAVALMTELRAEAKTIADEKAEQRRKLREWESKQG